MSIVMSIADRALSGATIGLILWVGVIVLGLMLDTIFGGKERAVTLRVALRLLLVLVGGCTVIGMQLALLLALLRGR